MMEALKSIATTQTDPTAGATRPAQREHGGMEYWRVERVARYLDVSRKRVYQLVQEKKLSAIRLSPRTMRILRQSIEQYLAVLQAQAEDELEAGA